MLCGFQHGVAARGTTTKDASFQLKDADDRCPLQRRSLTPDRAGLVGRLATRGCAISATLSHGAAPALKTLLLSGNAASDAARQAVEDALKLRS